MMALKYWQGADVGVDSPKVTVSCRLGAYWFYLGYSTTERVLSSVCESHGSISLSLSLSFSLSLAFSFPTLGYCIGQPIMHELNIEVIRLCQSNFGT